MVAALSVSQNLIVKHCWLDLPLLVFRVQGRCEVVSAGKAATTVFPFQVIPPAQTFSLRVAANSRVRRRLVDCQCAVPHISRYAGDEGFSHFGRFAALYREHFGELPSETVQWRRRLQAQELLAPALS